jgi:hypothetical protein
VKAQKSEALEDGKAMKKSQKPSKVGHLRHLQKQPKIYGFSKAQAKRIQSS